MGSTSMIIGSSFCADDPSFSAAIDAGTLPTVSVLDFPFLSVLATTVFPLAVFFFFVVVFVDTALPPSFALVVPPAPSAAAASPTLPSGR